MSTVIRGAGYRPDIDGLRAVAVILVVLYHAGAPGFSGGFVGVDVFFVISGYLITRILQDEMGHGAFSLSGFYARRARRLLPALIVVLGCTLLLGAFTALPSDFERMAKAAIATLLFVSNIFFWTEAGYFSPAAESSYLLHTWSLGVEEQFYILYPLFFGLFFRRARQFLVPALTGVALVSLATSVVGSHIFPGASFYLAPTRAWELLAGGLLALSPAHGRELSAAASAAGWAGLAMIFTAAGLYTSTAVFPGIAAALPVLGAVLVIASGNAPESPVRRLLALRPLVYIGLASYSLYLWHRPVLFFFRDYFDDNLVGAAIVGVLISFVLSAASLHLVERPFRSGPMPRSKLRALTAAGVALFVFGGVVTASGGLPFRVAPEIRTMDNIIEARNPRAFSCRTDGAIISSRFCLSSPEGTPSFAIWGDSHALVLSPGIFDAAHGAGATGQLISHSSCPPLFGVTRAGWRNRDCAEHNSKSLQYLEHSSEIKTVIMVARWAGSLNNLQRGGADDIDGDTGNQVFRDSLRRTIDVLLQAGKEVVIVAPVPSVAVEGPKRLVRAKMRGRSGPEPVTFDEFKDQNAEAFSAFEDVVPSIVRVIHPSDMLCDETICAIARAGIPLYYDSHHLTVEGSRFLAPLFQPIFNAK
ncbi:MAG: acyltransferase family protein [Gammaproteobacteria bacterium]